mmetsp:Transcript_62122/g.182136  ORF Transcript_62122/g.182136 Transcript_62122/m.182136 type:complete len:297 (-) Transcript_62122:833-1723(-)
MSHFSTSLWWRTFQQSTPQAHIMRYMSFLMASEKFGCWFRMRYTNWSKSIFPLVPTASNSLRISPHMKSTCSLLSDTPSISLTVPSISSKSTTPLWSLSKALKACHSTGRFVVRFWSRAEATNSWTFRVPEPSRSSWSKRSSSSWSTSGSSRCFFRPLQTSFMLRTPSPLASRQRKAVSTVSCTFPSRGSCEAMTRHTKRLNSQSSTFLFMFSRSSTIFFLGNVALATLHQECLRIWAVEILMPGLSFIMFSMRSRASSESLLHICGWNLISLLTICCTRSLRLVTLNGVVPESIW